MNEQLKGEKNGRSYYISAPKGSDPEAWVWEITLANADRRLVYAAHNRPLQELKGIGGQYIYTGSHP